MGGPRGRKINHDTRIEVLSLIQKARKLGCSQLLACQTLGLSERTVQRWGNKPHLPDLRKGPNGGPRNKLTGLERNKILQTINSAEYGSLSPCQIVPKLADKGLYIGSESSIYRILKQNSMLCHREKSKQRMPYRKPESCKATAPKQVWSWDITFLKSSVKGRFYYLYLIMDIYSRKIVGHRVFEEQTSENAALLAKEAYQLERIDGKQIILHSDNGSPMKGSTMLITLQKLGVVPSFNRPAVSNDNPFSEALFRTLKYNVYYPCRPFESINQANEWVLNFVHWYNNVHMHSGIKFLTPQSRHEGKEKIIIDKRQKVYELAKKNNPCRWSRAVRNWLPEPIVMLNPEILENKAA